MFRSELSNIPAEGLHTYLALPPLSLLHIPHHPINTSLPPLQREGGGEYQGFGVLVLNALGVHPRTKRRGRVARGNWPG